MHFITSPAAKSEEKRMFSQAMHFMAVKKSRENKFWFLIYSSSKDGAFTGIQKLR